MANNDSIKRFLAAMLFVAAGFVGVERVVMTAPLAEWWLPVLLGGVGVALVAWQWVEERAPAPDATMEAVPPTGMFKEWDVKALSEKSATTDDLARIEGIGPKIAAALVAAGIDTFAKLAKASEDDLRMALRAAGVRGSGSIGTWAAQAAYAARGDWDGLKAYQDTLVAGRKASQAAEGV